jgi:hypothetical protein
MYYWKGKPKTAAGYYKKAIELDPGNEETMEEYRKINNELKFVISLKSGPVQEIEENYEINAIISRIKVEKRINDWFHLEANYLLDYSNRVFTDNIGDTTRWYSTPWIKAGWLSEHHRISGWIGYTTTDNKFSSYGLNWKLNYNFGKFKLSNALTAGYDYFYYWNEVGAKSISDNLELGYGKFDLSASYAYGVVDAVLVADEYSGTYGEKTNPYTSYGLSLAYRILSRPVIKVGLNYSFLDYTYKSPLYYTPFERNLYGGMASLYYDYKSFYFYGSFSYNLGTEINYEQFGNSNRFRKEKVDVDNWSANVELGYQHDPFSISIGGSNFYNPFYRNITGFLAIKFLF